MIKLDKAGLKKYIDMVAVRNYSNLSAEELATEMFMMIEINKQIKDDATEYDMQLKVDAFAMLFSAQVVIMTHLLNQARKDKE